MSYINENGVEVIWERIKGLINSILTKYTSQDSGWVNIPCESGFKAYSSGQTPQVKRQGVTIIVRGAFKPTATVTDTNVWTTMGIIPDEYCPANSIYRTCQGSGRAKWKMRIAEDGRVMLANYGTGTTSSSVSTSAWLVLGNIEYRAKQKDI